MDDHDDASKRERAYAELCRRMAGLRDQDPAKLRFYWGSLFVAVLIDQGGLEWSDVEPLWQRWRRSQGGGDPPRPGPGQLGDGRRRGRSRRSRRGHRGGRGGRRRGWWREPPIRTAPFELLPE